MKKNGFLSLFIALFVFSSISCKEDILVPVDPLGIASMTCKCEYEFDGIAGWASNTIIGCQCDGVRSEVCQNLNTADDILACQEAIADAVDDCLGAFTPRPAHPELIDIDLTKALCEMEAGPSDLYFEGDFCVSEAFSYPKVDKECESICYDIKRYFDFNISLEDSEERRYDCMEDYQFQESLQVVDWDWEINNREECALGCARIPCNYFTVDTCTVVEIPEEDDLPEWHVGAYCWLGYSTEVPHCRAPDEDPPVLEAGGFLAEMITRRSIGVLNSNQSEAKIDINDNTYTTTLRGKIDFLGEPGISNKLISVRMSLSGDPFTVEGKDITEITLAAGTGTAPIINMDSNGKGTIYGGQMSGTVHMKIGDSSPGYITNINLSDMNVELDWANNTFRLYGGFTLEAKDGSLLSIDIDIGGTLKNQPPTATAGPDIVKECNSRETSTVLLLEGSAYDPDGSGNIFRVGWYIGNVYDGKPISHGCMAPVTVNLDTQTEFSFLVQDKDFQIHTDLLSVKFQDTTPPKVKIYKENMGRRILLKDSFNGSYINHDISILYTASDICSTISSLTTLDGTNFPPNTVRHVSQEKYHKLFISTFDDSGNQNNKSIGWTIDKTKPVISISGVTSGVYYNTNVTPVISIVDVNRDQVEEEITLNNTSYTSGTPISTDGRHSLKVNATDKAGNYASAIRTFGIDKTPPSITITGVTDGAFYTTSVEPVVTISDANLATQTMKLNGSNFSNGLILKDDGEYTLSVSATDLAGNSSSKTVSWTIDQTPPEITVTGVSDGLYYSTDITPIVTITDAHPDPSQDHLLLMDSIYPDGIEFTSGTTLTYDDTYTLKVQAVDQLGNQASVVISWIIDKTPPSISITGVTNGLYYNTDVTPVVFITDANLESSQNVVKLNGIDFTGGASVSEEGNYTIEVSAVDKAGNSSTGTVSWVIDKTPPDINITGIEEGARYYGSATAIFMVTDANLDNYLALLNGSEYISGTEIKTVDLYTLSVTALDLAGNSSSQALSFEVRMAMPPFNFAMCSLSDLSILNNGSVSSTGIANQGHIACHGDLAVPNNAALFGSSIVGGNLSASNNANIVGDVYLTGTATLGNNAQIQGEIIQVAAATPCDCDYDVTMAISDAANFNDNSKLTAIAQNIINGGLVINDKEMITLPAGDFYLKYLEIKNNATLKIEDGSLVRIFVAGNVYMLNNSDINCPMAMDSNLFIVTGADSSAGGLVKIRNNTDNALNIYAPLAEVEVENNAALYGAIVGRKLSVNNNGDVYFEAKEVSTPKLLCQ